MHKSQAERVSAHSLWFKDALIYELHVRSFMDSNADGIGDFPGLIDKLDYLADLGVTALWLLPFYPSPLKDDGYDIADYTGVNPAYGSLRDVRRLIKEAHERGMRIITELVANHTSDQHPWFQRARRAKPGSNARDFYVWSETPDKYRDARIIFKDYETANWAWDPIAQAYYWHRFYSHQPDLNYDNPAVLKAVLKALDFWMEAGVDAMRLDAVPYLFEREGTNSENLPETHAVLKQIRAHIDAHYRDRMLLAEANQWPEDSIAYFGEGDECHMNFHFPLMPRMFMAIQMEDRFPIVDILAQTPAIPANCQWALFLRNHDELTLEMVTDEERDYMYRVYTTDPVARLNLGIRRRLAPLLGNNRRRIELMNGLLFSLPGTPVLYYGDEIGMGDTIYLGDRNGVRTPMQWSADRNAGFSTANRQRLFLPPVVDPEYHYESVNVETQRVNPNSLLNWNRRLIALRRRHAAFGRGDLKMLFPENRRVLAFVRTLGSERILVIANLSRFVQYVELDLREYEGLRPVEMFGGNDFPPIGERPYFLTLGPHSFYWFTLLPVRVSVQLAEGTPEDVPELVAAGSWRSLLEPPLRQQLQEILPSFLRIQRWYGGKARSLRSLQIVDCVSLGEAVLLAAQVEYREGDGETYAIPIAFAEGEAGERMLQSARSAVVCRVEGLDEPGVIYDAMGGPELPQALLAAMATRRRFHGERAVVAANTYPGFRRLRGPANLQANVSRAEQSNNSVVFGERLILKLFRRLVDGENPDLEVGRFLSEDGRFPHTAQVAGSLQFRSPQMRASLGMLTAYVPNRGDAWGYTLAMLEDSFDPERYRSAASLLGRRTGELHLALASDPDNPAFRPEPSTMLDQRSVYHSVRALALEVLGALRRSLPAGAGGDIRALVELEPEILGRLRRILSRPIQAARIRIHGDYHLGQVLWTGTDFVIIDFEGEPARTIAERRLKRWPLRDVAGMLRSFDYAAATAVAKRAGTGGETARRWVPAVGAAFLEAYQATVRGAPFEIVDPALNRVLLETFLVEKALYEIRYELNNRPSWAGIPIRGLLEILEAGT